MSITFKLLYYGATYFIAIFTTHISPILVAYFHSKRLWAVKELNCYYLTDVKIFLTTMLSPCTIVIILTLYM